MVIFSSHTLTGGLPGAERSDPEFIQMDRTRTAGNNFRTLTWSIHVLQMGSESACILTQGAAKQQGGSETTRESRLGRCRGLTLKIVSNTMNHKTTPITGVGLARAVQSGTLGEVKTYDVSLLASDAVASVRGDCIFSAKHWNHYRNRHR